jgi:small subunit ribosomal protein S10
MKYQIKIKSLNKSSITFYQKFVKNILDKMNIKYSIFNLPVKQKRLTILKSPHVNKSAREQFEVKFYSFILQINKNFNLYTLKMLFLNKPKSITASLKNI